MPKIEWNPDARQAYNFEPDDQAPVGFVKSFKIGTRNLFQDVKLRPPTKGSFGTTTSYVGVIERIDWGGSASDKLELDFRVSTANRHLLVNLTHAATADTVVEVSFLLYDYDSEALEFYEAFKTDTSGIKGTLAFSSATGLDIKVTRPGAAGSGERVEGVDDWYVALTITPYVGVSQNLHFATGKNMALVKKWGTPAETGTGTGGTSDDSAPASTTSPFESSSSGISREELDDLKRNLEETVRWVRALTEVLELKIEESDLRYTVKTTPGKLRDADAARLRAAERALERSRDALGRFAP